MGDALRGGGAGAILFELRPKTLPTATHWLLDRADICQTSGGGIRLTQSPAGAGLHLA